MTEAYLFHLYFVGHSFWPNQARIPDLVIWCGGAMGLWPCTSSTLIGGKGGAGPISIHTTLEGLTDGLSMCECKMDVESARIPTWHQMDHVSWSFGLFQKPPLGGRPNTKPGDHGTLNAHNLWFFLLYHMWGPAWIEIHWNNIWLRAPYMWLHTTLEGPWPHYMTLEVCWNGLWTRSFGLSQFHGHGSWLVCKMAFISYEPKMVCSYVF